MEIIYDLMDICGNDKLNIYFLSESIEWEYCIHNAESEEFARRYVKHGDRYYEWDKGSAANQFWLDTKEKRGANDPEPREAVFHVGSNIDLKQQPFFGRLETGILKCFPEIGKDVLRLCIEGPNEQERQALSAGTS